VSDPIPPEYAALVDDAAIFPPGNAPLDAAVRDYLAHAGTPYAALVGPFVVSARERLCRNGSEEGDL